jgi:hypothetical protein
MAIGGGCRPGGAVTNGACGYACFEMRTNRNWRLPGPDGPCQSRCRWHRLCITRLCITEYRQPPKEYGPWHRVWTLLIVVAAISFRLSSTRPRSVAIPIYAAVVMKIGILLATTQAAPIMLSVAHIGNDPAALQRAFDGFARWDNLRAVIGALGYCADVWALVAIVRVSATSRPTTVLDAIS